MLEVIIILVAAAVRANLYKVTARIGTSNQSD
jgi:hypothetical protein